MAEVYKDDRVISNSGPHTIEVWFEPWGMPHPLPKGQAFRVVARSPNPGHMEVVESQDSCTVYGWPGAAIQVYNGDELIDDFSVVFPELPNGMSTRSFVDFMFGGPGGPVP